MTLLDNAEQIITAYPLIAFGVVFLAGVLSSASPCVLATIPLVVGFVGGYADGDRRKAFRYSLAFVLGLSLTFTAFGAAAGMFGTMFGTLGGGWYAAAGTLALVMGGQLMGLYELRIPVNFTYKPKTGWSHRLVPPWNVLRGRIISMCYTGTGNPVDGGRNERRSAVRNSTVVHLCHRSLPPDAGGRNIYRFCGGAGGIQRGCQFLNLDEM